jgi:hypothetical protein
MAWYGNEPLSEVYYMLEINGPGGDVLAELKALKFQIENGYAPMMEQGLRNIFANVKQFMYARPDSMTGSGSAWHWKCLWTEELLPTPNGWTTMGALRVGDELFDETGNVCRVTGCSPVMQNHDCFEVTFEDGSVIIADDQHLWPVGEGKLLRTVDLMNARTYIPCAQPLELPNVHLPIDPYLLGVWLGDGSSTHPKIFGNESDLAEISYHVEIAGHQLGTLKRANPPRTVCHRSVGGLGPLLRENSLLGNKHIPAAYFRASKNQRLALLQGLMDTDGSIDISRQCGFTTTLPAMAKGFKELLRSLGIKPKFIVKDLELSYRGGKSKCSPAYQFWFTGYDDMLVFRLSRKVERQLGRGKTKGRAGLGKTRRSVSKRHRVISVEPIGSVPVRCISVSSPSKLYLAGVGMIPTHNTSPQNKESILEGLRGYFTNEQLRIRSHDLIEEMKTITRDGASIAAEGNLKDDRVLAMAMAVHYWSTKIRRNLIVQKRPREAEAAKKMKSIVDQTALFNANMLSAFMGQKAKGRLDQQRLAAKQAWRYGRR